jgi:hypothetical protein
MKRGLRTLAAALAVLTILTVPAQAANASGDAYKVSDTAASTSITWASDKHSFSLSYSAATADAQYLLLVVKADADGTYTISKDSILYIDQQKADSSTVTFSTVYPSEIANSVILLSSSVQSGAPVKLGAITVGAAGDVDSSGKVDIFDVVTLARKIANKTVTAYWTESAADVEKDGSLTTADLTKLAQAVASGTTADLSK